MSISRVRSLVACALVVCSSVLLASTSAMAAGVTYILDNSNSAANFPDGTGYLQVTLMDISGGRTELTVQTLEPLNSLAGSNFGIQGFSFNLNGLSFDSSTVLSLPDGWQVYGDRQHSGFGRFDVSVLGRGNSRTDMLTLILNGSVSNFIGLSGGTAGQGNELFAAHVAGMQGPIGSAHFGGSAPAVPLPASVWLFLSGLGLLGFFKSWQRKTKSPHHSAFARRFSLQHYAISRIAH